MMASNETPSRPMNKNMNRSTRRSLRNGAIPRKVKAMPNGMSIGIVVASKANPSVNHVSHARNVGAGTGLTKCL